MSKRNIKTFEPDSEVAAMLSKAKKCGIKLGWICNEAIRRFLKSEGYDAKKVAK